MLVQIKPHNPGGPQAVTVCTLTVQRDLCVGCGICVPVCPTGTLEMVWNDREEYIPVDHGHCRAGCHVCVDACPFLDQKHDEDTIARDDYASVPGICWHPETGYYLGLWAGHATDFRPAGASGGITRWFLARLIEKNIVDRVLCVTPEADPNRLFRFSALDSSEAVLTSSKSAYYPMEMSEVIARVLAEDARYAIVALPCFLKGLKLAMRQNVKLRRRIVMTAGLVCGQTKSKAYGGLLTRLVGLQPEKAENVSFREKDPSRPAIDYIFAAKASGRRSTTSWTAGQGRYKEAYVTGMFKPRCCDYCDDVFGEVGDVAFMDAWLPEYEHDGRGTNLVLTRSPIAEQVLCDGAAGGELHLEPVKLERILTSQDSVIPYKRDSLAFRLYMADEAGVARPHKRIAPRKPDFVQRRILQAMDAVRRHSVVAWKQQCASSPSGVDQFYRSMQGPLLTLGFWKWVHRRPYRYGRAILKRLRRVGRSLRLV